MLAVLLVLAAPLVAARVVIDWPHWRGTDYRGATEAEGLPVQWSKKENVVWVTDLPGPGAATPAVSGERVFVSSLDTRKADLVALCLDRGTGEVLWSKVVAEGEGRTPSPLGRGTENTMAAPSPVTDGETVCFLYGSGDLAAFDFDGNELWRRDLVEESGKLEIQYGYASSPLLFEGRLFVQVLHRAESYLLAIDPRTGADLWQHMRETKAKNESREAYTTPIPFRNGERWEVLVLGGDCLTGHDPGTGEERWRWAKLNPRRKKNLAAISTAVAGDDGLIVVTTPRNGPLHGLRVRDTKVEELWELKRPTPSNTTPLLYRDRLYAIDGRNSRMVCLDPERGKVVWQEDVDMPGTVFASPTAGDGKIYVVDNAATVAVLAAGDEHRELGRSRLDASLTRSSLVIDGGQLLIRTADRLYCISEGAAEDER